MASLEEIKNSLQTNSYLTNDIKENIMELIINFNSKFPGVDLTNLSERLKTLKIVKGSRFVINGSSCYNPITNELSISLLNLDNIDCKHTLMRELLNIMTAKDDYTGFNKDNVFQALNVGYTEILANLIVGNDAETEFEDEILAVNLVAQIVGDDKLYQAYFTNNANLLINEVC